MKELKQVEALLEKYEQRDADDDNDKQLLGLAEALEFELCQTYAREGNVYKMMVKLCDTLQKLVCVYFYYYYFFHISVSCQALCLIMFHLVSLVQSKFWDQMRSCHLARTRNG